MIDVFYCDLFLIRRVFEPILHRLQRWNCKDNLWWAKKILDALHGILFVYALFLIINTQYVVFGIIVCCYSIVAAAVLSFSLREMLAKTSLQNKNTQHPFEVTSDIIRRGVLRGERNPLEKIVAPQRILLCIKFILMAALLPVFTYLFVEVTTIIYWLAIMIVVVYIISCTPLPPQTIKKDISLKDGVTSSV